MKRFTILFVFALAGCQTKTFMDTNYDDDAVAQQAKALVVMRTVAKLHQREDVAMVATWRNTKTNNYFTTHAQQRILFYESPHDRAHMYTIEPGQYVLTDIEFIVPATFLGRAKTYSAHDISPLVFFEVQPGEKAYVGDLIINAGQSDILAKAFRIRDYYEWTIKGLKKEESGIDYSFGKNLMRFTDHAITLQQSMELDGGPHRRGPSGLLG